MTAERWLVPIDDALDEAQVGAKARNLALLRRGGHRVPDAVVIPDAAFQQFLAHAGLAESIAIACSKLDARSPMGSACAADTIAALVRSAPLPDSLHAVLDEAWARLRSPLIVRSSAVGEDSAAASFAGQLDSIAHVTSRGLLHRALLDVWASRWSARVLAYQLSRGRWLAGMGAVVQAQIDAAVSGVLFTRAPYRDAEMILEYCAGGGDALVSGRENPGRIAIARDGSAWSLVAHAEQTVACEAQLLNDERIAELRRGALEIERAFGGPQDIEWAIDTDGSLWFLQSRPITTGSRTVDTAQGGTVRWSNANVNENFPEPITPLLYSIASTGYYHYFRNLGRSFGISAKRLRRMEQPLRHIIGVHGARMYYNLTSIHSVLRSAPFGELLADSFNLFVGAEATDAPPAATRWRSGFRALPQIPELLVVAAKTSWQYLFLTRRVTRFERRVSTFAEGTHPHVLRGKNAQQLLDDFRGFLEIRNHRWNDAALADAAAMVSYGLLKRLLASSIPDADQPALHNNLLKALPGLVSSVPAVELWNLSRLVQRDAELSRLFAEASSREVLKTIAVDTRFAEFQTAFAAYLEDWGFRGSGELMLTTPGLQETPDRVIDLVRQYMALRTDSPAAQLEHQASERVRETARVRMLLRRRPFAQLNVSIVLRWTQKAILLRERARLKQALLYSRLRRILLSLGQRLVSTARLRRADDIFFLTVEELDALVSGSAMFPDHARQLVSLRRHAHQEVTAVAPPDSLSLAPGAYFTALGDSGTRNDAPLDENEDGTLRGVGACGGTTTARAAVVGDLSEASQISAGDVLVTRQTDPGWGPVFPLISALVIERGGMLSHGAIIAREFGIPSVVGVRHATSRIVHGHTIHVNGDRGIVRLMEA